MKCPLCDGQLGAMVAKAWGKDPKMLPILPFVCGWCAGFMLIEMETRKLIIPNAAELALLKTNKVLWDAVEHVRMQILALPDRRTPRQR